MTPFWCRLGRHEWNLAYRRVGEDQTCARGCGTVARATENGWVIERPS